MEQGIEQGMEGRRVLDGEEMQKPAPIPGRPTVRKRIPV